jgi:hypothetical protein
MSEQVRVEDSEVLNALRIALIKFRQAADSALLNAENQVSRTHFWLDGEQTTYWQNQLRARADAVTKAREAVRQKKLYKDASGRTPSAVEEEKMLKKCLAALEEAQQKLEAIRKWLPRLEKEADLYRGGVARLRKTLDDDVPRAVALLERLALSVEEYVQIEAPGAPLPEGAVTTGPQETVARGGDAAEPPPAAGTQLKPKQEGGDVGTGQ